MLKAQVAWACLSVRMLEGKIEKTTSQRYSKLGAEF
jgi:hypothetical protein